MVLLAAVELPVHRGRWEKTVAEVLQANKVPKANEVILVKMAQSVQVESKEKRVLRVHEVQRETEETTDSGVNLGRREAWAAEESLEHREDKASRENLEVRVPLVPRAMSVPKDPSETMDQTALRV